MLSRARCAVLVVVLASSVFVMGVGAASAVSSPGRVRNLSVVVTVTDRGSGATAITIAFDQATAGGPTDHYQVDECQIPGGAVSCTSGWASLPDIAAGPAHIVVPGALSCPAGFSTCDFRVRGVDATGTLFSGYQIAGVVPWAPFDVTATSGPGAGEVTIGFGGPSELGAPGDRRFVASVCTAGCALDSNWSDSGLSLPYPSDGAAVYSCGANVTCSIRMQFVDGDAAVSTLSDVASAIGPVLTIDHPVPAAVTNDATIAGACTIGMGTVTATVNPGAHLFASPCSAVGTWSVSIASLADAAYSVSASQASSPLPAAGPVSFTYDATAPIVSFTPANGATVGPATWNSECTTPGICGSVTDATSGVVTFGPATVRRSSDAKYWNGSGWQLAAVNAPVTGTAAAWSIALPSAKLNNGVSYTVTMGAIDAAGNSVAPSASFTYDSSRPAPIAIATTNGDGAIGVGDTFAVTFSEAIDPASATGPTTLTISRTGAAASRYTIAGFTIAALTTGSHGYVTPGTGTRTVTYNGTLSVSGSVVTFTVTSACVTGCAFAIGGAPAGSIQFKAASTVTDLARNVAATAPITTTPVVFL